MKWRISRIYEADYGCEERQSGEKLKCIVELVCDDNVNKTSTSQISTSRIGASTMKQVIVDDDYLTKKNLKEGDEWIDEI